MQRQANEWLVAGAALAFTMTMIVACTQDGAPLPTSSSALPPSSELAGITQSPLATTVVPAPTPDPDPEPPPPPKPRENGDPVTLKGSAQTVTGCPDNCVIEMKGLDARVSTSTKIIQIVGLATFNRTTNDLRAGLPLKVRGIYQSGSVNATTVTIRDRVDLGGTLVSIGPDSCVVELSSGGQATFSISSYAGIVFGSPQPGDSVRARGEVLEDLSLPFVLTRLEHAR